MARIPEIATTIAPDASTLTLTPNMPGVAPLTIAIADVGAAVRAYATAHGLKQRLIDAAALGQFHANGPKKGQRVTMADKWQAVTDLWSFMSTNDRWHRVNVGGEGGDNDGLLIAAIMRVYPTIDREKAEALIASWDRATQAAMRDSDPTLSPVVAEIRRERAKATGAASAAASALAGLAQAA